MTDPNLAAPRDAKVRARKGTTAADVWRRVEAGSASDCWPWIGVIRPKGYGAAWFEGRKWNASRLVWRLVAGITPPSHLFVCHTCHNPPCCNPNHLYLGDATTNNRDAVEAGRNFSRRVTHCPQGHPYDDTNTRWRSSTRNKRPRRDCFACKQAWRKKRMREASRTVMITVEQLEDVIESMGFTEPQLLALRSAKDRIRAVIHLAALSPDAGGKP